MKKIVIIGCYFGKLRKDYKTWLKSCEYNDTIDWIIFSDCDWNNAPQNVKIVKKSFYEIKEIIQSKFDFKISLDKPYKLCDYKPAYGYIFKEYIKDYDIWGYCDFDMIFGDIRKFITNEMIDEYDKIYTLGHLSLYKNNDENNAIFKSKNGNMYYKNVFQTNEIKVFDEKSGIYDIFLKNGRKVYSNKDFIDLSKFSSNIIVNSENKFKNNFKQQTILIQEGKVFLIIVNDSKIQQREVCYVHFSGKNFESSNSTKFMLTSKGVVNIEDKNELEVETINNYNIVLFKEFMNRKIFKVKRKISKIINKKVERYSKK